MKKIGIFLASFLVLSLNAKTEIILSGAGSVGRFLQAHQAQLEAKTGERVRIKVKTSAKGISDLLDESAEIAMVSGNPRDIYAAQLLSEDLTRNLHEADMGRQKVAFVVGLSNGIGSLNIDQLRGIYSGSLMNWKEVKGSDAPIFVFALDKAVGLRLEVDKQLGIADLAPGAVVRMDSADVIDAVSRVPESIAYMAEWDVNKKMKVVNSSSVTFPVFLITRDAPDANEKAVIKAAKEIFKGN